MKKKEIIKGKAKQKPTTNKTTHCQEHYLRDTLLDWRVKKGHKLTSDVFSLVI